MKHSMKYVKRAGVVFGLILGAVATNANGADAEKFVLKEESAAGDSGEVVADFKLTLVSRTLVDGKEVLRSTSSKQEQQRYNEEILAVDAKGPVRLRRTYSVCRIVESESTKPPSIVTRSPEGKTVLIERTPTRTEISVVSPPGAKLDDGDEHKLSEEYADDTSEIFPLKPVAVGESWKVESPEFLRLFVQNGKLEGVSLTAKLLGIGQHEGRNCARIRSMLVVPPSKDPKEPRWVASLSGDLYFALDLRRTLSFELAGPIKLAGPPGPLGASASAAGRASLKVSQRWLKVAGKAVTSPTQ